MLYGGALVTTLNERLSYKADKYAEMQWHWYTFDKDNCFA